MVEPTESGADAKRPKPPASFEVKVTYNGVEKKLAVTDDEPVSTMLSDAIKLFPISEAQHLLALFDRHGVEITNEAQSVKEAGLEKNDRTVLRQSAVKGG